MSKEVNWQQECLKKGFEYVREPDDHYVVASPAEMVALLRVLLGVDVRTKDCDSYGVAVCELQEQVDGLVNTIHAQQAESGALIAERDALLDERDRPTRASADVLAERRRQVEREGWTPAHDDLYSAAELPRAAAAYVLNGANDKAPCIWPFHAKWWKPRDARANYVRAAALLLAEIERIDRASLQGAQP